MKGWIAGCKKEKFGTLELLTKAVLLRILLNFLM
jgi:hypothetical protein